MKLKLAALIPLLLVTACQNQYAPDHSLKKAWTTELESTQPSEIPYGLVYEAGSKKVIYTAVATSNSQSLTLIESLIKTWKPQVVLCQGHTKDILLPSDVRFKMDGVKLILKGASADRAQITSHLAKYGMSQRDYEIYSVINLMNQVWKYEVNSPKELKSKAEHHLKSDPEAKTLHLTYADVQKWFQEKTGHAMTEHAIQDGTLTAPEDPNLTTTSYLQKMSFYQDEIDDAVAMEALAKALKEYDTVMIIRAASKYVVERDVIHKMLGVSAPVKVIH